jgi:hypothetical protein
VAKNIRSGDDLIFLICELGIIHIFDGRTYLFLYKVSPPFGAVFDIICNYTEAICRVVIHLGYKSRLLWGRRIKQLTCTGIGDGNDVPFGSTPEGIVFHLFDHGSFGNDHDGGKVVRIRNGVLNCTNQFILGVVLDTVLIIDHYIHAAVEGYPDDQQKRQDFRYNIQRVNYTPEQLSNDAGDRIKYLMEE